ncbi:helix-turn-helix transcriptional regulator [Streptomyces sp. NPDC006283]|uniref:helix-turn-helix domain-containing protein n=1 Tax=Streptomyces sp. NPDC006283 TaxID=3156741 RepID=UPI0033B4A91C
MGAAAAVDPGDGEANVAAHVKYERELRGWSTGELARRVSDAGCPVSQSAIWRIENGEPRRKISVDELIAFSRVFGRSIDDLLKAPRTEFPEAVVQDYVEHWLRSETTVWHKELDASVAFGDVVSMAVAYPVVAARLEEVVNEIAEERKDGHLKGAIDRRLDEFSRRLAAHRSGLLHLSRTKPLIDYWRRIGLSPEQMVEEAKKLKLEGTISGSLRSDIELARLDLENAGSVPGLVQRYRNRQVNRDFYAGDGVTYRLFSESPDQLSEEQRLAQAREALKVTSTFLLAIHVWPQVGRPGAIDALRSRVTELERKTALELGIDARLVQLIALSLWGRGMTDELKDRTAAPEDLEADLPNRREAVRELASAIKLEWTGKAQEATAILASANELPANADVIERWVREKWRHEISP